jgi:hypothetical protein
VIEIENIGEVFAGLDLWVEACEELADHTFRGLVGQTFRYVIEGTPEWSGDLVASWRITVGAPAAGYSETPFKEASLGGLAINPEPYSRVMPNAAAIRYAMSIASSQLPQVHLGSEVFISNPSPYAQEVEDNAKAGSGRTFIRPVNLVDGRVEMAHAAVQKFDSLGELSEAAALAIAQEKLA